jgi:hypothetical protein
MSGGGAYDPATHRMIVFGGRDNDGNNLNDVWVLVNADRLGDLSRWVNLIPNGAAGSPPARSGHSTVYDSANNRLIIFGGCGGYCAPVLNDAWVLTNANGLGGTPVWTQLAAYGPPARTNAAAAYDPNDNQLIIFGGQDGSADPCSTFSDAWILEGANGLGDNLGWWEPITLEGPYGPTGQNGASAAFDPTTGVMTVFGGMGMVNGTCTATNAVWQLSTGGYPDWGNVIVPQGAPGSPPPRSFQSAVYDGTGGRMLVFGGVDASGNYLNDVWSLSNATGLGGPVWSMLSPSGGPPAARSGQAAVFDSASNRMTIFGGGNASGVLNDTWLLTAPGSSGLSCNAAAGIPYIVRGEGITEQVGDLVLTCTGGTPTPQGEPIPEYWITLTLNTNVTSRRLPDATGLSEAVLLIDEAFPANPVPSNSQRRSPGVPDQILCTPLGLECAETGTGGAPSPYQTQPNVFVGKQSSATTLYWKVPIDAPGVNLTRVIRLTNLRADASQLGIASGQFPTQIQATVGMQGLKPVPVANPQQVVAVLLRGLVVGAISSASIPQCEPHNAVLLGGAGTAAFDFSIPVTEDFGAAFKGRNYGTSLFGPVFPPVLVEQNVPGFAYFSETGLYSPSLFTSAPTLGLADFGTRILVSLGSIAAGTHLFIPTTIALSSSIGQLQLVQAASNGASAPGYEPIAATAMIGTTPVAEASSFFSTAYAVYEVIGDDPSIVESAAIPVAVAFRIKPATGAVMATTTLAPLGAVETANQSSPIPRFANLSTAQQAYAINSCPAP